MAELTLRNTLRGVLAALEFPVYDFDPDSGDYTSTGQMVTPDGVQISPEQLRFDNGSSQVRGRIMRSQRWEVKLSFNETVHCHEVFSRLAANPPQVRAIVPQTGEAEEPGLSYNWTFHLDRVQMDHIPSASPQKGSTFSLTFDVTHA